METREETEAREKKLVDDTKKFAQGALRKVGINITNPLAGLDELPTTEESLDADSLKIYQDANKPIEQLQGFAKEGLKTSLGLYGAALGTYGTVGNQPRNMINITKDVEEIFSMNPNAYRRAVAIYKNHEGGISWKKAMDIARRSSGLTMADGNYNYLPNFYDTSDDALISLNKDLKKEVSNYNPILGRDELTPNLESKWKNFARQGDKTYYYDTTYHRMLDVPGMSDPAQKTRYKSWLTNSLINRYNKQLLDPQHPFTHFDNQPFYDSQGMEWRLVRTDKAGVGPDQPYEPMPLNEIDSRKLKSKNTSESEKVLLRELMKLNVKDRNRLEKANPGLIRWNSDTSGQNYHEHMIGLDETEFWNSGAGKALGYMNNDVYNLDKGMGNIVFLNDPRFKIMKDNIAEYITPSSKEEVYPGLKKRVNSIKTFTNGPHKGMNAVIGYDADPSSKTYTNIVIRAYNPSPNVNQTQIAATMPNWYSNVYAKDLTTGERVIPESIANKFVRSYVDAVLEGNTPAIVALEDLTEQLLKDYKIDIDIPAPGGLQQDTTFQNLGGYSTKSIDTDPLDLKTFKTTPKIQRSRDRYWKRQLNLWEKGRYTQLEMNLEEEFPNR